MDPDRMFWTRVLTLLTVGLVIPGLVAFFSWWGGAVRVTEGKSILRYVPPMRIAGVFCLVVGILFPFAITAVFLFKPPQQAHEYWLGPILGIAFCFAGFVVYLETKKSYAAVSDEGIVKHSPFLGTKQFAWGDIQRIETYPYRLVLICHDKSKMRFTAYWGGTDSLLLVARERLGPDCMEAK